MRDNDRLVIKQNEKMSNLAKKMLDNNSIPGIIGFEEKNDSYIYDIKGLVKIGDRSEDKITLIDIEKIYRKLYEIKKELNNYMIDEEYLSLDLNHIFINDKGDIHLLALFDSKDKDIKHLFRQIMDSCHIEYKDNANTILDINNYFNKEGYTLEDLLDKFFTKSIQSEKNIVEYKKNAKKESIKQDSSLQEKYFKKIKSFFIKDDSGQKKKDYKERSLNINFRLPKK